MITVIGLGIERGDISRRGEEYILDAAKEGKKIVVRTANTRSYQTVVDLGVEHVCLDYVYQKSRSFSTLSKNLAKAVCQFGEDAVYLVDGCASEDYSVKALHKRLRGKLQYIDGVSKVSHIAARVNFSTCSYTAVSAYELQEKIENDGLSLPLIVYDLDDRALCSDCKLLLGELFGEEILCQYVCGEKATKIPLYALDRQRQYNYSSAVAIERQGLLEKQRFTLHDLRGIVVKLRKPDGCPWDKVQTNESIKMSAVEESYELVDAIDSGDDDKILEETGDILLQVVFHGVLKEETGAFTLTDVLTGICKKLISRHTHVFGNDKAKDDTSALNVWEKNKMQEKHQTTYADAVNDVPKCFPAVMRAQKVGKRAGKAGMDFACIEDAKIRLQEELNEFSIALLSKDKEQTEKEFGDVLFSAVNVGRLAGCDCEKALKESVERFAKRFTLAEQKAIADGKEVTKLTAKEWDKYYLSAKKELKDEDEKR